MDSCRRDFDEKLLSGYLDGVLTQSETQRVRLHLEECAPCRRQVEEMEKLREVTMTTRFFEPADDQWNERPRGLASRLSLHLGWGLLLLWLVGVVGFVLGNIWSNSQNLTEKLLAFGGIFGFLLIFLSVLVDRLQTRRTDRYRGVLK